MSIITAIITILVFSLLIFIHELGHFSMAKLFKVKVHEFAIGMGPVAYQKRRGETAYSVRWIPLGGFVSLEGEDVGSDDPRALSNIAPWKRLVILAAGGVMNMILGLVLCIIFASIAGIAIPKVNTLLEGGPAQQAGIHAGDTIVRINDTKINTQMDVHFETYTIKDAPCNVTVLRDGEYITFPLTLMHMPDEQRYVVGYNGTRESATFLSAVEYGCYDTIFYSKLILVSLGRLATGRESFKDVAGPVGIIGEIGGAVNTMVSTQGAFGVTSLLSLMIMLTINLGLFNLLPIPALDGGRMLFVFVEMITRKKMPPEKEGAIHLVGFVLLMVLMIFATSNDVSRIFWK